MPCNGTWAIWKLRSISLDVYNPSKMVRASGRRHYQNSKRRIGPEKNDTALLLVLEIGGLPRNRTSGWSHGGISQEVLIKGLSAPKGMIEKLQRG